MTTTRKGAGGMKKALIGLGVVGALAFTACGSDTTEANPVADYAWDSLSGTDQKLVCVVVSDGVQSDELAAFQQGSSYAFTQQEAIAILDYIATEKC